MGRVVRTNRRRHSKSRAYRLIWAVPLMLVGMSASSFAFFPTKSTSNDPNARVFGDGLKIKLDRSSPAFAILEDEMLGDKLGGATERAPAVEAEPLHAGAGVSMQALAEKIARANQREASLIAQERRARENAARAFAQMATQVFTKLATAPKPIPKPEPVVQKAKPQAGVVHPTRTISLTDLRMSREELLGAIVLPMAQAAGGDSEEVAQAIATAAAKGTDASIAAADRKPGGRKAEDKDESEERTDAEPAAEPAHQVYISGPIEFSGGLALANTHDKVVVYREHDGELMESGAVWLREGRYEIFVESTEGDLIAELRTPYGDVLGRANVALAKIPAVTEKKKADSVALRIKPIPQGVSGRVASYQKDSDKPLNGAHVAFRDIPLATASKEAGRFEEKAFLEGSNIIVRATRPGHWASLGFASTGHANDLSLLPTGEGHILRQLAAIAKARGSKLTEAGVVWGRVTNKGQPVAGATVDILTENVTTQAIYFNEKMEPAADLETTTANGYYAFFPVVSGSHSVQAKIDERNSLPVLVPTENKTVSRANLELSQERKAKVRVFDAFRTSYPLAAEITTPGVTSGISVGPTGEGFLPFPSGDNVLMLDSSAGSSYERVRLAVNRDRRVVFVPMVQSSWLDRIRNERRINKEPATGVIVGFVQAGGPYRAIMDSGTIHPNTRIVYFNSRGEVVSYETGVPGGGYAIFNVPDGFKTVAVQAAGSPKLHTNVVLVQDGFTNVMNHWLR